MSDWTMKGLDWDNPLRIYTPEDIRSSVPAAYFSEQTQKNMEKQRLSCGADASWP